MKRVLVDSVVKFFISFLGIIAIFITLKELQHIFIPFVLAYFLFFSFSPFNTFLTKKKFPLWSNVLINLFLIISGIGLLGQFIISSFSRFGDELPNYIDKLNITIINYGKELGLSGSQLNSFNLNRYLAKLNIGEFATGVFSSTIDIFSAIFLVIFFFIFINSGHDRIFRVIKDRFVEKKTVLALRKIKKQHLKEGAKEDETEREIKLLQSEKEQLLETTFKNITEQIQKYIFTKALISLTTSVIVSIVLALFGVDFILVWAVLTFVLNFIPNIGSVIAVILPTVMCLLQFGSVGYTGILALILVVVQNLIGNIIEPKIFGNRLGLNPIVILLSLLIWGYVWGIAGMILSVPLTAVLKIIFDSSDSKNLKFFSHLMSN